MWRRFIILLLTAITCGAIPKAGSKRELQRLVQLPPLEFAPPLLFDRSVGFVVFPLTASATADAKEILREAKGNPDDAINLLQAARVYGAGGDLANAIRTYNRAAELFGRKTQADPGNSRALVGRSEALSALGRFGEAQAALEKAAAADADAPHVALGYAHFYKEKAWSAFVGEEHRFSSATCLETLQSIVRKGDGSRIETAQKELRSAEAQFAKAAAAFEKSPELLLERACFLSLQSALQTAIRQIQRNERSDRELQTSFYNPAALLDLKTAASSRDSDPDTLASAIFAWAVADARTRDSFGVWPELSKETSQTIADLYRRLSEMADSGSKAAPEAAEYLGCVQLYLMRDYAGAERNFRAALRADSARERSWEMLLYSIFAQGDLARSVAASEDRASAVPNSRSSAFLIKSYDRQGDTLKAEWTALAAATAYPHDFLVNLSLAALLMKRENLNPVLWRAGDALNRAEKQIGPAPSREAQLSFVLLKSIYLALSDQPEQARALLRPYLSPGQTRPEVQQILEALDD